MEALITVSAVTRVQTIQRRVQAMPKPSKKLYEGDIWALLDKYGPKGGPDAIPFETPDADCQVATMRIFYRRMMKMEPVTDDEVCKDYFNHHFGWWCPTRETIAGIATLVTELDPEARTVLEVGSGRGMAAQLLREAGLNIRTAEPEVMHIQRLFLRSEAITGEAAVAKYPVQTLLMAYPPQKGHTGVEMSANCARRFAGAQLIYVGEPKGGSTGTDEFFSEIEKGWTLHKKIAIRRWSGIADAVYVYRRRGAITSVPRVEV